MIIQRLRFPRTNDAEILYLVKLRINHPPPPYNPVRDGSWNPADGILDWLLRRTDKQLKKLCKKHALDWECSRKKQIGKLWLHWRAVKLGIGDTWVGYEKGYDFTRIPDCNCASGRRNVAQNHNEEKQKEELKELAKRVREYIMSPTIHRFPRYKKNRIHFPRLEE